MIKSCAKLALVLAVAAGLWSAGSPPARAQTATTGVVLGKVLDPSGAVVAGAEVTLTDVATNRTRTLRTGAEGQYIFPNVLPGTYTLLVGMRGFRTASVSNVIVEVNRSTTVDVSLELGDAATTIEVAAGVGAELQTQDAQVGNVLDQTMIRNLPTFTRNSMELLSLQPATTPGGFATGGTVSGARSDQNTLLLDGIDVSDNLTGGQGVSFTQAPVGVDAVSEFRVTVANPNATFGRSAGGQVTLTSPRGSNSLHGVAYWYHQNDNLNANTWTNNRSGVRKGELKDNRAGFSLGGPFWKDRTFFFGNYEFRRFPQLAPFTRTVPTASLRSGILTFLDGTGAQVAYPLATSMACGAAGTSACDPRGLGISPTVQQLMALMPQGNDPTLGDGLNTTGFRGNVSIPLTFDTVTYRMDHNFSSKLSFMGRYSYQRNLSPLGGTSQLDIRDPNNVVPLRALNTRGASVIVGLDYQISPHWINSFRFGWVQNKSDLIGTGPGAVGEKLGLPGTNTSAAGPVGLDLSLLSEPIDVAAQAARTQILRDRNIQFTNHTTWIKGTHTVNFGGEIRSLPFLFTHNDQVTFLTGPIAAVGTGSFLTIPAANRPPTCSATITTNCIRSADVSRWNSLYAATLGMLDNLSIVGARDGNLNPLPFGTDLITDTTMQYYQFHFQDTWRIRPSLTLTYGLTYSWLTPPDEKLDRIALITDLATGEVFSAKKYLNAKKSAALAGQVFNPQIGVRPINDSVRDTLFDTDHTNWGPRVAVAWNPVFSDGFMGRLAGRRMVVRGGFGIVYDRVNTVSVILPAAFGIGFGQVLQTLAPLCNASSSPGAGCDPTAGAGNRGLSAFRVGVDGEIPVPAFPPGTSPIVPAVLSGGTTFATDPNRRVGRNYLIDLTVQRELPANMVMEVGYIGRLGRELPIGVDLAASPYFFVDQASGQSFAQAFDNVACVLRGDAGRTIGAFTCPASLQNQPWFENQLPGLGTAFLTSNFGSLFQTNAVGTLFLQMNIFRQTALGLPPYNNLQLLAILMASSGGVSNYHAMFMTLRNRPWHGLQFDINYTLSKSLDQAGDVQNSLALITTGFDPHIDYGPALSDRRHVFNGIFNYDLPFGRGRRWSSQQTWAEKLIGGWYLSGIYRAFTSLPLVVTDNSGVWGGSLAAPGNGAIPLVSPGSLNAGIYSGVAGSGGVGTAGNPATGGSGLNLFADPEAAFNSFRRILLSQDGRTGRANAFRGPGFWNFDLRIAKTTPFTEQVKFDLSFDFFNIFNHVNFGTPSLSLNNAAAFGVINSQVTPPNRTNGARWIQVGARVSF